MPRGSVASKKASETAFCSHFREACEAEEAETEPESEDRARSADGRAACRFCGRKFNPRSLQRHEPVCQKAHK